MEGIQNQLQKIADREKRQHYLLEIIQNYIRKDLNPNIERKYKSKRTRSELPKNKFVPAERKGIGTKPEEPKRQEDSCCQINESAFFQGSQIEMLEKAQGAKQAEKQKKAEDRAKQFSTNVDLRSLQQTIQIYHQCMNEMVYTIKDLKGKIENSLFSSEKLKSEKLVSFWQGYCRIKGECKTFQALIRICHEELGRKFLSALAPVRSFLKKQKHVYLFCK